MRESNKGLEGACDTIGCVGVMNGKDGVRGRYSPISYFSKYS